MRWLPPILACAALSCSSGVKTTDRSELTTKQIVDRSTNSVVRVEARQREGQGVGTGFVVGADGRIATNLHVIIGAEEITVQLADKRRFQVDRIVAADPARDLAILHIEAAGLKALPIGNSDQVSAGERVVIIGNPLGFLDYTVSDGLISSVRPLPNGTTMLQTSAPISQGSSGGPLFNSYGEVIGVATMLSPEGQNLNFAVPSNYLRPLIAQKGQGITVAEFFERLRESAGPPPECRPLEQTINAETPEGKPVVIQRKVPCHDVKMFADCSLEQKRLVGRVIADAISKGAPIYNAKEHEACYVIYRKVASGFEGDTSMCKGIRDVFGQGLLRASTVESFTEKAWVIRDTFDSLTGALARSLAN